MDSQDSILFKPQNWLLLRLYMH